MKNKLTSALLTRTIITAFLSVVLLVGCDRSPATVKTADNTLERIQREKTLRVGYINYPPSAFKDKSTGAVRGHFVDTIQEIVHQLDLQRFERSIEKFLPSVVVLADRPSDRCQIIRTRAVEINNVRVGFRIFGRLQ
jgi:ABC-type amino acid transport substrate-binding protein